MDAVLDVSKVTAGAKFKGLEIELHPHSGARVLRVVHPEAQEIAEHLHDWAYIGIYTVGRYREFYDGGDAQMRGPSAVLHPAGRPHSDEIGEEGLETLTIEFDPAWLRHHGFDGALDRSIVWQGGPIALAARRLARTLTNARSNEAAIGAATSRFLRDALSQEAFRPPAWLPKVSAGGNTFELAQKLDLHPAWLARAYRNATGEGLHETARRVRVERASRLLRQSDRPLADIAIDAGFCDQSHMNRCFRAVLGRSPVAVRSEKLSG